MHGVHLFEKMRYNFASVVKLGRYGWRSNASHPCCSRAVFRVRIWTRRGKPAIPMFIFAGAAAAALALRTAIPGCEATRKELNLVAFGRRLLLWPRRAHQNYCKCTFRTMLT
jgi:hypothetical protein